MPHSESSQAPQLSLDTENELCHCFARMPEVLLFDVSGVTYHLSIDRMTPEPVKMQSCCYASLRV